MNDLTLPKPEIVPAEILTMPTLAIRAELIKALTWTAVGLGRLAMFWAELERRGEDLNDLREKIPANLPKIAAGILAAEAVVAFAGRANVLRALEGVPLDVQRRLADGETIPVYLPGEREPKALPLARIPTGVVSRIIADGVVRTPAEQRLAIRAAKRRKPDAAADRRYTVTVDREARTLKIGKMTIPIATIIAALAESAGARGPIIDTPDAPSRTAGGKFTDEEIERLKAAAKAHDLKEWEMVRQAVVAWWML